MTQRLRRRARCGVCGLHLKLCICDTLPRLETRTRVVIIMHSREARRTSNTARLALACLPNSTLVERAEHGAHEPARLWSSDSTPAILFPAPDATPLDTWRGSVTAPVTLVVPDGTWGQASRLRQRVPGLAGLPCVSLPAGPPSVYRLRAIDRLSRVSTLEAIARALGLLESFAIGAALERVLAVMVDRTLWMRGRIDRAQVTDGIPNEISRHF
jgi:DTW domain-containing protein